MTNLKKNLKTLFILAIAIFIFSSNISSAQVYQKFLPITYDVGCIDAQYDLSLGSRDYVLYSNVLMLQTFLFQNNIMDYAPTGYFGPITQSALMKYQSLRNIYPTGAFDANTRKAVARDTCSLEQIVNNNGNIGYYPNTNTTQNVFVNPNMEVPTVTTPQYPNTNYQNQGLYINLTEEMLFPR